MRDSLMQLQLPFPIYYMPCRQANADAITLKHMLATCYYVHSLDMEQTLYMGSNESCKIVQSCIKCTCWPKQSESDATEPTTVATPFLQHIAFAPEYNYTDLTTMRRFPLLLQWNQQLLGDAATAQSQQQNWMHDNAEEMSKQMLYYERDMFQHLVLGVILQAHLIANYAKDDDFEDFYDEYCAYQVNKQLKRLSDEQQQAPAAEAQPQADSSQRLKFVSPIPKRKRKEKTEIDEDEMIAKNVHLSQFEHDEDAKQVNDEQETKATTTTPTTSSSNAVIPRVNMTLAQLLSYFTLASYQRGRDYFEEDRISNLSSKIISSTEQHGIIFKLYSKCQGSLDHPYIEQSIIKNGLNIITLTSH